MKWNWLLLPFLCLVLGLSACSGGDGHTSFSDASDISDVSDVSASETDLPAGSSSSSQPAAEPEPITDAEPERNPEDVERLEGTWACSGVMLDGQLVMFSDVPELGDLYDQTLTINSDGTYILIDTFSHRGVWAPMGSQPFEGFDHSYLFSKQYDITYSFENDQLTSEETKNSASYIISLSENMPNHLVWLEKVDGEPILFLFQRDGGNTGSSTAAPPAAATPPATATMGEQNALKTAHAYLDTMAFSYSGLIEQLEYEGYTHSEAVYGADHCGADWNEQAALSAASYLDVMSFSRSGLIEQLEYEGFTHAQAVYGVEQNGY